MPDDANRPPGSNGDNTTPADDVILSEQTPAPGSRSASTPTTLSPHDLATPYVLDALELDERESFERHLANCHACQMRVADLEDAALLLPDALVTPPADLPDAFPYLLRDVAHETLLLSSDDDLEDDTDQEGKEPAVTISPEEEPAPEIDFTPVETETEPEITPEPEPVSEPIEPQDEQDAVEEGPEAAAPVSREPKRSKSKTRDKPAPEPTAPDEATQPARPARPPGRIRPGVRVPANASGNGAASGGFQITPTTVVALALGLIALGLFLWSLLLLGRVGDLESEIDQQNEEIAALRQQANATAFTLTPTTNGPAGASGTFFFSLPDQQGALVVRGLNAAESGWTYQLWFIDDDRSSPIAGPLFTVDENGEAVVPLQADMVTFDAVAISLEPSGGSPAPTSQVILQGRLGGAAG